MKNTRSTAHRPLQALKFRLYLARMWPSEWSAPRALCSDSRPLVSTAMVICDDEGHILDMQSR